MRRFFNACHPLGKQKGIHLARIIIKLVYFKVTNEAFFRRTLLGGSTNFLNRRPIFIEERSPKFEKDIQIEVSELKWHTATRNSEVRRL